MESRTAFTHHRAARSAPAVAPDLIGLLATSERGLAFRLITHPAGSSELRLSGLPEPDVAPPLLIIPLDAPTTSALRRALGAGAA